MRTFPRHNYYGHHNLPDLVSSYGSTDPGLSNWAILTSAHGNCPACGMLFTCQQMCRILLAWGGKMQKTRDNSLTLQIEDSWRNGYELAANNYCCCIASDCRFTTMFGLPFGMTGPAEKAIRWVATGNHCNYCTYKWSFPVYLSPLWRIEFQTNPNSVSCALICVAL